ncbi:MAG: hypothetical protein PT120_12255 [Aphanizomenon gracile PMC649.10]|jgi:hypothetical protein|nr:hypothetical protein [Aphanizomenon gracile PMC638.10]MDM3853148.1 hypothetical protein [Aphanizomenon gracile PMC627.10]MDM3855638.1 hypothetical protein [Aphanizomenon gracile PMC649.10]
MTLSKFLTTLGISSVLVAAQVIGLPNQKPKVAQAHCPLNDPLHCASHADPTPLIPGSKKVAEEAWGEAGRGMYRAAAEFMSRDNRKIPAYSLDSRQKELLRPEFGSLVDKVTVQYGADMMDRWGSGKFQISQGSDGQTFCNRIYIQDPYKQNDYGQLILLAHELQHSRQCENLGGMSNFGYRYFKEFKKAGQSYANNSLEREAETVANRVQQYVDSQPNVTSQSQGIPSQPVHPIYSNLTPRVIGCYSIRSLNRNFRNSNFRWLDAKSDDTGVGLVSGQSHGTVWLLEEANQSYLLRSTNQNHRSTSSYRWLDGMSNGTGVQLVSDTSHGAFWRLEQVQGGYHIRSLNNNFSNNNPRWLDGASNGTTVQLVNGTSHGTLWELTSTTCP